MSMFETFLLELSIGVTIILLILSGVWACLIWIPRKRERKIVKERLQRIATWKGGYGSDGGDQATLSTSR